MTEWLGLIGPFIGLITIIIKEFLSERAKARERNEKFEIDQKKFLGLAEKAIIKIRSELKDDSRDARDAEDRVDDDLRGKF